MTATDKRKRGSVEVYKSGKARVRFRTGTGRPGKTFTNEAEANKFVDIMAGMVETADLERDVSLAKVGEEALTKRELRGKVRDVDNDWSRFHNHIERDEIGKRMARTLSRGDVEAWFERLEDKDLSEQTIRNCRSVLSVICEHAIKKKLFKLNPTHGIRRDPETRTDEPWTYAQREEQAALIAAAFDTSGSDSKHNGGLTRWPWSGEERRALVETSMGSGLREGEMVALRLEDVHLTAEDPHLWVRYGGPPEPDYPKGAPPKWGRIRRVALFGHAKRALERWIPLIRNFADENPHGLVFPRPNGGYRDPDHILRWEVWKGILARANITRDFRWHDLRHTCGASMISGWWGHRWELIEIRDHLGHRELKTTERYAHLGDTAQKEAARRAEEAFQARAVGQALAHAGPRADLPASVFATISTAPPTRVERATNGLGNRCSIL